MKKELGKPVGTDAAVAVPKPREPETAAGAPPPEGLTGAQAAERLARFGPNAVTEVP